MEFVLRKMTFDKSPNNFFAKCVPNNYQYNEGTIRKFQYHGVILEADLYDYVGHYLYFGFQDKGHSKLLELIEPGFTVIDVGTNIGSSLLQFANKIGPAGKVFGFEPDVKNYNNCIRNIDLNSFKNVAVENIGLGDNTNEHYLNVNCESNRGMNSISLNKDSSSIKVIVNTLDNWMEQNEIHRVDLIKIDVEGYEMSVVKGALKTIASKRPILFIELIDSHLKRQGSSATELVIFLLGLNYKITNVLNGDALDSNYSLDSSNFDIICEPK